MMQKQIINLNGVDDTMVISDMYMFPSGKAGYCLAVLGKNGESLRKQSYQNEDHSPIIPRKIVLHCSNRQERTCLFGNVYQTLDWLKLP
eukprot:UN01484